MTFPAGLRPRETIPPTPDVIEHIEAAAWKDLQLSLPDAFRQQWDIDVLSLGGATALRASRTATLAINRVIGLGLTEPVTDDILDRLIDWYARAATPRFVIQWSPAARPETTPALLTARGFTLMSYRSKLWRPLNREIPERASTRLTVREIGPDHADTFEMVVAAPLGVPPELGPGVRSTIGKPGWRFYLAFSGDRPVAGAASFQSGDGAWFGVAATMEEFRRQGAQTALIVRRLQDAAADGCRWASADTAQPTPEQPNPSYENMSRLGFITLAHRPSYLSPG